MICLMPLSAETLTVSEEYFLHTDMAIMGVALIVTLLLAHILD